MDGGDAEEPLIDGTRDDGYGRSWTRSDKSFSNHRGFFGSRNRRVSRSNGGGGNAAAAAVARMAYLCRGRPKFAAVAVFLLLAIGGLSFLLVHPSSSRPVVERVRKLYSKGKHSSPKVYAAEVNASPVATISRDDSSITSYSLPSSPATIGSSRVTFNQAVGVENVSPKLISYQEIHSRNSSFNLRGKDVMVFLHIQKTGGTTFGRHLVQDIDLDRPCECRKTKKKHRSRQYSKQEWEDIMGDLDEVDDEEDEQQPQQRNLSRQKRMLRCDCLRPNSHKKDGESQWLFSRHSTGWRCGLHADWTELNACVDSYFNAEEGLKSRRYFYVTFLREPVGRYLSEWRHVQRGATWKVGN